ncbi:hypothetical protein H5410_030032, partial [Solanum commersonii]
MCIKCKSPRFCLQVFGLNPHRRPYALTLEAINLTFTNATKTAKKIHTFLDQTNDENLKEIYDYCLNYYESSIELLRDVEEYLLKHGKYDTLSIVGNFVKDVGSYCENKFRKIPNHVYVSTLTKDNKNLWIFGSIIMVFGLNPHRSPYELTQEAINLALRNASETASKIAIFLDETNDNNLKVIYNYCLDYYHYAINSLRGAEENFLKDGLVYDSRKANFCCENEFQRIIDYVYASTLTKDNERMGIFGSIIVAAADLLSNSTL